MLFLIVGLAVTNSARASVARAPYAPTFDSPVYQTLMRSTGFVEVCDPRVGWSEPAGW
jgi:hypothetical protein